jgi:hypothetical protein
VPEDARRLMAWKLKTLARVVNGWSMNTDTMGVYGDYYLKRAIVTQLGLGANVPEDGIYPINLTDETGKPLDGANKYPDGSLDLYVQNESPGADKEGNWLPTPKGPFNLTMRLYAPRSEALTGRSSR